MLARAEGCAGDFFEDDFHFMRKDASGTWSWKLPNMPASDKDLEGRPVNDPETAPLPGHYTVCGYYKVEPAKVRADLDSTALVAISGSVLASVDVIIKYI
jgi:hypothetical protein